MVSESLILTLEKHCTRPLKFIRSRILYVVSSNGKSKSHHVTILLVIMCLVIIA